MGVVAVLLHLVFIMLPLHKSVQAITVTGCWHLLSGVSQILYCPTEYGLIKNEREAVKYYQLIQMKEHTELRVTPSNFNEKTMLRCIARFAHRVWKGCP